MPIVGGLDIHRKQITFDYLDTSTGQVQRGQVGLLQARRTSASGCVALRLSLTGVVVTRFVTGSRLQGCDNDGMAGACALRSCRRHSACRRRRPTADRAPAMPAARGACS
jgi:hypothetical protein